MSETQLSEQRNAGLGLTIVIAATVSISVSNILTPMVYALGVNTETLLVLRLACFLVLCSVWIRLLGISLRIGRRNMLHCIGSGVAYAIGSGSLIAGFFFMPVSLVILIFYTFPLLIRLSEALLDRRPPSLMEIAFLLTAFLGLAICLGIGFERLNAPGMIFSALAALAVTVSFVWNGRKLASVPSTVSTFYMAATGFVLILAFAPLAGGWRLPPAEGFAIVIVAATALTFAGAFLGMYTGVRMIGASRTGLIMNLEPVLTIALAIAVLDEQMAPNQFVGAALVIAAIYGAQRLPAQGSSS
ncbi:DMT family transporter [Hoeflea poritis]|uniref:DMT family transporter n=1 Tax=Hoeflea poritis TaxID=2993659 RepID=A0ABT4VNC3_9HYPH|nr:DMT family transporter [Hoeflea poritis]MDA4845543.1 DMT family transporter [Hoeflea poritis]